MKDREQHRLFNSDKESSPAKVTPKIVASVFEATRLTQARRLAALTKKELAERIGVSPAAIGQYEAGVTRPRPDLIPLLAEVLSVPITFFMPGRPHGKLDGSMAHFRSLRTARAYQRAKAVAFVEQVWELAYALEKRVQLPPVDLPGFAGGEVTSGAEIPTDPVEAARSLRVRWGLGTGPISHLVRHMEAHGIIVVFSGRDKDTISVDAFSTSALPRPIVVLTPNRFDDVYRHRFSAAHELGHLILHGDTASGDMRQEREADAFAAEFLTPRDSILSELPTRTDFRRLAELRTAWGVSIDSLLYRCRELGLLSDSAISRAHRRLHSLRGQPGFDNEPVSNYPGEQPVLLASAFELASRETGLTIATLARELCWPVPRVRELMGLPDQRPTLRLVP